MLFTIGYQGTTLDRVVARLRTAGVRRVLDVRALAVSRKPGFARRALSAGLQEAGIGYVHLPALGTPKAGRDAVRHGDVAAMHRIFGAHLLTDAARQGMEDATALAQDGPVCLLCFERAHDDCHRKLVAELLHASTGAAVRPLFADLPEPGPLPRLQRAARVAH